MLSVPAGRAERLYGTLPAESGRFSSAPERKSLPSQQVREKSLALSLTLSLLSSPPSYSFLSPCAGNKVEPFLHSTTRT